MQRPRERKKRGETCRPVRCACHAMPAERKTPENIFVCSAGVGFSGMSPAARFHQGRRLSPIGVVWTQPPVWALHSGRPEYTSSGVTRVSLGACRPESKNVRVCSWAYARAARHVQRSIVGSSRAAYSSASNSVFPPILPTGEAPPIVCLLGAAALPRE